MDMRAGYVEIGLIVFLVSLIFTIYTWPLIDFETENSFEISEVEEGDKVRYIGDITDITRSGDIFILELDSGNLIAYTKDDDFKEDQRVFVTIEFGGNISNYDENTYLVQPFPTTDGMIGMVFTFVGLGIIAAGARAKKQRLEDVIKFETAPPLEMVEPPEDEEGVQKVTCPSCKHVFGVSGTQQRPARISCPQCGTTGIVE
jgi:hypothetical protein